MKWCVGFLLVLFSVGILVFVQLRENVPNNIIKEEVREESSSSIREETSVVITQAVEIDQLVSLPHIPEVLGATPEINALINTNSRPSFKETQKVLHSLQGRELSREDQQALLLLVAQVEAPTTKTSWLSLKNVALMLLLEQDPLPEALPELMKIAITDPDQHPVWREYVLQFYSVLVEEMDREGKDIEGAVADLFQATNEKQHGLAGTSLLSLERLSRTHHEVVDELEKTSRLIAFDSSYDTASRTSAFNVLGELGLSVEEDLLPMLVDSAQPLPFRLAVVHLAKKSLSEEERARAVTMARPLFL